MINCSAVQLIYLDKEGRYFCMDTKQKLLYALYKCDNIIWDTDDKIMDIDWELSNIIVFSDNWKNLVKERKDWAEYRNKYCRYKQKIESVLFKSKD